MKIKVFISSVQSEFSKTEFVDYTGLANRTAERLLKKFVNLDLIEIIGAGRNTKYIINE